MEIIVDEQSSGRRLDAFVASKISTLSRSRIQALIKTGVILLNGSVAKPRAALGPGDQVSVGTVTEVASAPLVAQDIPLDILFEDSQILVINKPPDLVVHPGAGNQDGTLVNALLHHADHLPTLGDAERPGIVHRLDRETSGCLVVALTDDAYSALTAQFAERRTSKQYLAIVEGHPTPPSGTVNAAIERHPVNRQKMAIARPGKGREACTDYRVLHDFESTALVHCRLHTGRTHQIRVHLKSLGHPLCGDKIYNPKRANAYSRQLLHAWQLGLFHPTDKKWMDFTAPVPDDFIINGVSEELLHE